MYRALPFLSMSKEPTGQGPPPVAAGQDSAQSPLSRASRGLVYQSTSKAGLASILPRDFRLFLVR